MGTGAQLGRAGISVGDNVTLDVQGNWTNDALTARTDPFGRPTSSILTDGGSIALTTRADYAELVLGDQVQMLAYAGAWLQRDGTMQAGNGGSTQIPASAPPMIMGRGPRPHASITPTVRIRRVAVNASGAA